MNLTSELNAFKKDIVKHLEYFNTTDGHRLCHISHVFERLNQQTKEFSKLEDKYHSYNFRILEPIVEDHKDYYEEQAKDIYTAIQVQMIRIASTCFLIYDAIENSKQK